MTEPEVHHMNDEAPNPLLAASRLTGADMQFLQLAELVMSKLTGRGSVSEPEARVQIERWHAQFRQVYASIFQKHLGAQQALSSLAALESAPVQRFLATRQMIAPEVKQRLAELEQRMGNLEI